MHIVQKSSAVGPAPYANYLNGSSLSSQNNQPYLGWNYPAEYQHLVHQHWRSFPLPEIYYQAFLFMAFLCMLLSSLFGNGLVLWIFSTSKNLRTPSNMLIINLAVFDLTMAINMPHYLVNAILGYFHGGDLACDIYAVFGSISGIGAAITNAFIAFDRYRTISNPIDGRLNFPQIIILIIATWLWTAPFSILPFFHIWGHFIPGMNERNLLIGSIITRIMPSDSLCRRQLKKMHKLLLVTIVLCKGFLTSCSFDYLSEDDDNRYFVRVFFVWAYCIPMFLICLYYTKLFLHVRDHERMLAEQAKKMNVKSLSANHDPAAMTVEMRIAKAAMTIYLLYVFAWTPYATVSLLGTYGYRHLITPFASMIPSCCAKLVSCIDPWVYAASHPKYRAELEKRLPWLGIREKSAASSSSNKENCDGDTSTISADN